MSEEIEIQPIAQPNPAATVDDGQQGAKSHPEGHDEGLRFPKHVPIGEHVRTRQERNRYRDEANTLRAKLEVYERGGVQPSQGQQQERQQPAAVELPKRPVMDEFQSRDAYERAMDKWVGDVAEAKAEAKAAEKIEAKFRERDEMSARWQEEQRAAQVAQSFTEKASAAAATVPDIQERVAYLNDPQIVQAVAPQIWLDIMESDHAADLVVELTNDTEALRRIMGDPVRAARELGRLEAKIAHGKTTQATPANTAEAPAKPAVAPTRVVRGAAPSPTKDLNDPNISPAEFSRLWDEQERNRRRR